jgi:hypothetical protein
MKEMHMYIRDKKTNAPYAIIMALKMDDGKMGLGWSSCHKGDTFNKEKARLIAHGRCLAAMKGRKMLRPYVINDKVVADFAVKVYHRLGTLHESLL